VPELHLNVSALQRLVLLLDLFAPQGPELIWTCLHYGVCATPGGVYTTGPELHLKVSALQWLVLLLEVCTQQGHELHLKVSTLQRPVLLLEVSTIQRLELIRTSLHFRGLCCSWRCLHHRVLAAYERVCTTEVLVCAAPGGFYTTGPMHTYCQMCLLRFENNLLAVGRVRFALKIIFFLSNVFASLRK
jgi:hypothetical protein